MARKAPVRVVRSIYDVEYQALIEKIRDTRVQAGIRQEDVAKAVGMTQSQYSKIERAERRVDILEFIRIVEATGSDPSRVLADFLAERNA